MRDRWRRSLVSFLALAGLAASSLTLAATPSATAQEPLPRADILDVDFTTAPVVDAAQGLPVRTSGAPGVGINLVNGGPAGLFDGVDDAYLYSFVDQYPKLTQAATFECAFRYEGELPSSTEKNLCAGKEAGGYSITIYDSTLTFMAHVGGAYRRAEATVVPGTWYHAVATWDGAVARLYLNGDLVDETAATGALKMPSAGAQNFAVGADAAPKEGTQFYAKASIALARVYSSAVSAPQAGALYRDFVSSDAVPAADVLDVTFDDGTPADAAQQRTPNEHGTITVADSPAVASKTITLDGASAVRYPFATGYEQTATAMSVQCAFRYNNTLPVGEERNLCAAKEAGGFGIVIYDDRLSYIAHIGGAYQTVGVPIVQGRWYNAVGTWDGSKIRLYVDGVLAAEKAASGTLKPPPDAEARNFVVGGDAATRNRVQFTSVAELNTARVWSRALTEAEIAALNGEAIAAPMAANPLDVTATTPAAGDVLNAPVTFGVEFANPASVNEFRTSYQIDGQAVTQGQSFGTGLKKGAHELKIFAEDVYGRTLERTVRFASGNIVSGGGAKTEQGKGSVTLSAVATNPSGGAVETTFLATDVTVGQGNRQGVVGDLPTTLEFTGTQEQAIDGRAVPGDADLFASASTGQLPYQRFDVAAPEADARQEIVWTGTVDPQRSVVLYAWDGAAWAELGRGRGIADAELSITGTVTDALVHDGVVHALVLGDDPFADDIGEEVTASFADPDAYDFSIAHLTDTQYLTEGAVEQETAEERAVWQAAYTDVTRWIADNARERKIAYAAHTGDIIEDWLNSDPANTTAREHAKKEFEVASAAQRILEDAGVVNSVLPGNHDNLTGRDNGAENLYNEYFGPERYAAQESTPAWQAYQASHTEWKPGDNSNHYDLFSVSGLDFVAVHLGFDVTEEEATWAREVLAQYKDRNAIVLTHAYNVPSTASDGRGAGFSHDGYRVFNEVINRSENVFLVLSGHEHGVSIVVRKDVGASGANNVVELLADYQFYKVGSDELGLTQVGGYGKDTALQFGASFFRLLQFDIDRSEMIVDTYSPLLKNFGATEYDDRHRYNGTEDDFTIPIQLSTRSTSFATNGVVLTTETDDVIGSATSDSGWPASVTWDGLTEGEVYGWRALSRDAQGGQELLTAWRVAADGVAYAASQSAVFLATAAGTDKEPPVITAPSTTTVTLGDAFDPMAGVVVTDNTDGDLTAKTVVSGAFDTKVAGTYVLVYQVADTNGNQAIAARALIVQGAEEPGTPEPSASASPEPSASASAAPTSAPSADPTGSAPAEPTATAQPSQRPGARPGLPSTGGAGSAVAAAVGLVALAGGALAVRRRVR